MQVLYIDTDEHDFLKNPDDPSTFPDVISQPVQGNAAINDGGAEYTGAPEL